MLESTKLILYGIAGRRSLYILWLIIGSRFRKSIHASLLTMSFCPRIVITIALQEVDNAPDAKTCAQCNHKGLQYVYRRIEKCHRLTSLSAALRLLNFCVCIFVHEKSRPHQKRRLRGQCPQGNRNCRGGSAYHVADAYGLDGGITSQVAVRTSSPPAFMRSRACARWRSPPL